MLVSAVPASLLGTNCWVLAPAEGEECLLVDPGFGVLDRLSGVLEQHRLRPAAVLLTHGHIDHTWSVTPVCRAAGIPALVHGDDAHRLTDPLAGLGEPLLAMIDLHAGGRAQWEEPEDVRPLADAQHVEVAGLSLDVLHTPGHTEGSAVFVLDGVPDDVPGVFPSALSTTRDLTSTLLSGDVLFAGSIGRTDLPGGDAAAMERSLREVVLPMPDDRLVLPGHGGATSTGRERAGNPWLRRLL